MSQEPAPKGVANEDCELQMSKSCTTRCSCRHAGLVCSENRHLKDSTTE